MRAKVLWPSITYGPSGDAGDHGVGRSIAWRTFFRLIIIFAHQGLSDDGLQANRVARGLWSRVATDTYRSWRDARGRHTARDVVRKSVITVHSRAECDFKGSSAWRRCVSTTPTSVLTRQLERSTCGRRCRHVEDFCSWLSYI